LISFLRHDVGNKTEGNTMKQILVFFTLLNFNALHANDTNIQKVLDAYMQAWAEHNITKIDTFYADDVLWYDLGTDTVTKGKVKMSKAITDAFLGYVPDMYWKKSGDIFVSGNSISYEWVYGGTFTGKWGQEKVSNKKFHIKGFSTTTINDAGKIIAQKDYYDMYSFMMQLGLALKP